MPLATSFREALAASSPQGVVWGADADPDCVGRYFVDRFWEMPRLDSVDAASQVVDFCEREQIQLVIPTRDGELPFFSELAQDLLMVGTLVSIGSSTAVDVCLDKLRFHDHCQREGISTVPTSLSPDELPDEPLVIKERRGMGSRGLAVGLERERAAAHGSTLVEPIFQPMQDGIEYSVDVYVNRLGQVVEAAPRARLKVHDGEAAITETVEHPALVELAVALATSLELRGHLVIQGFGEGARTVLLECNPRVGGASSCGFHAGVLTPQWSLQEAMGDPVAPRLGSYLRGVRMVRYAADRFLP